MSFFRKKPVVIEAVKFRGANWREILAWFDDPSVGYWNNSDGVDKIKIHTLEGLMVANVGDWIIRGIKGEFYPCKSDIFEATYERVDTPQ